MRTTCRVVTVPETVIVRLHKAPLLLRAFYITDRRIDDAATVLLGDRFVVKRSFCAGNEDGLLSPVTAVLAPCRAAGPLAAVKHPPGYKSGIPSLMCLDGCDRIDTH